MTTDRSTRITDGMLTVPCCWATVHGPPWACICPKPVDLRKRLAQLEQQVVELKREIGSA